MTPTLMGRWQTRIAMLGTIGLLVTLLFALSYEAFNETFFYVLGYVAAFGLAWDIAFIIVQKFRWDRDWPPAFQWIAGGLEALLIYLLIDNTGLWRIDEGIVPADIFAYHYTTVFVLTWAWTQGPMRAVFPRWRFNGGEIL